MNLRKKSIMLVKVSRKQLNYSKEGLYIDITNHFFSIKFTSNWIVCILKDKLGKFN